MMGNYEQLISAITAVVKTNNNQEITGALLQQVLRSMVTQIGSNATFAGIATPATNPSTPDQNVFYLASEAGMYPNFGGYQLEMGKVAVLSNSTGAWVGSTLDVGSLVVSGYVPLDSVAELPDTPEDIHTGYLIDGHLYVYVGTGGDTAGGKYQDCGAFQGAGIDTITTPTPADGTLIVTLTDGRVIVVDLTPIFSQYQEKVRAKGTDYMGYKTLDPSTSFASQVTETDTIYVVQQDFDLNSGSITIPSGSEIQFDGGCIKNGTVKFQGTLITCDKESFDNVTLTADSTIQNKEINLSWFKSDNGDYADVLTNICNITYISNIYLDVYDIKISHPVVISKRACNIRGKEVFGFADYDLLIQEMSTVSPTSDYSASGYDRNAAFLFTTLQCGTFSNVRISGGSSYKFGYGAYYASGYTGNKFEYNVIQNCYIAGLCMYTTENTYINHNNIDHCGTGIFCSSNEINEANVLDIANGTYKGADNWLTLEGNEIMWCNYGFVGSLGSNTNIVRTGVNHCSCYGIFVYNSYSLAIDQCYFEGNGKSSFWIDENGLAGDTDGTTMCSHLLNEHLGEFGNTITQGWGVSNYHYRGAVMVAGGGFTSVDTCHMSTNQRRTTPETTDMRNLDNTACGLDCMFSTLTGQNLSLNNLKAPAQSNFTKYMTIIAQYTIQFEYNSGNSPKVTYSNVNNTSTFFAGFVNNYEIIKNHSAKIENGNFHEIIKDNTKQLTTSSTFNNLSWNFKYVGVYDGIRMFNAYKASASAYNSFVFRIPKSFFTETKIIRIYLRVTDESDNVGIQFNHNTAWVINGASHTITKDMQFFEYVVAPESVDATDGYIFRGYTQSTSAQVLFSPLFVRSIDQEFSSEIKLDNFDETYMQIMGWNGANATYANSNHLGFVYFDTRWNKYVMWNGSKWVDYDGASAGVARSGATDNRPSSASIYTGFIYWDATLQQAVVWNGSGWVVQARTPFVYNNNNSTVTLSEKYITNLGNVTSDKTINLPSTVDAAAEYKFRLAYTSGTISGTAFSSTAVANDATLTFTAGKTYQVTITGGILYFSETTTPS